VEYGLSAPELIDIEAIAYVHGLMTIIAPLKGAAARLLRKGERGVIRVADSIDLSSQRRFCVAHELGHFLLHRNVADLSICTAQQMVSWQQTTGLEPEANLFAAELLMPEELFRSIAPRLPTLESLEALAEKFRTTLTATLYRYVELGVVMCALVVSQEAKVRWFLTASDFGFRLRGVGSSLDPRTCAADFFGTRSAAKLTADVPANAWLEDERVRDVWQLRELMFPMPRYRSTASVLWIVPGSDLDRA
jgi:hypothetical protein